MERIRVDISKNIESIITDLVNGNIDIKEANKIKNVIEDLQLTLF